MLERAFLEWDRNFDEDGDEVDDTVYTGILKCFCDEKQKNSTFSKTDKFEGRRIFNGEINSYPICETYISDTFKGRVLGISMSVITVGTNFIQIGRAHV